MMERVASLLASSSTLEELSESAGKEIQTATGVAASSAVITGAGREPKIIGALFALNEGQTSGALEGANGVYVVRVDSKTTPQPSTLTEADAQSIRAELEQQMSQRYLAVWLDQLREEADITDNRHRLLR